MLNSQRRSRPAILVGAAAAAGALGAAALMSAAGASAAPDDTEYFVPLVSSFDPTTSSGYPPYFTELQGSETWAMVGLPAGNTYTITGMDTQTTLGPFVNDYLTSLTGQVEATNNADLIPLFPSDVQIDLLNFGGGFANEWIFIPADADAELTPGFSDLLITPFGNLELFGTYFSDVATNFAGAATIFDVG